MNKDLKENRDYEVITIEKFYKAFQPNITTNSKGIQFYNSSTIDEDNSMPIKYQDALAKSSTHRLLVETKTSLIYGSGLIPVDPNNQALKDFLNAPNRKGESVNDVFMKVAKDISVYESLSLQLVYSAEETIAEIFHENPANVRAEEEDEQGCINHWFISKTWGVISNKKDKRKANDVKSAKVLPTFNPSNKAKLVSGATAYSISGESVQLLYGKIYSAKNDTYAEPCYTSALNLIELEYVLSDYVVNKVQGGYYPSGILYLNSEMPQEKRDEFIRDFRAKHEGTTNAGKIIFIFGNTAQSKPEFLKLTDDLGNSIVKDLMDLAQMQICMSHGANFTLIGIDKGSADLGGDANKLNVNRLKYIEDVIKPFQTLVLNAFNKILSVNGLGEVTIYNSPLKIQQPMVDLNDLTRSERRKIVYGLPPHPDDVNSTEAPVESTIKEEEKKI